MSERESKSPSPALRERVRAEVSLIALIPAFSQREKG